MPPREVSEKAVWALGVYIMRFAQNSEGSRVKHNALLEVVRAKMRRKLNYVAAFCKSPKMLFGWRQSTTYEYSHKMMTVKVMLWCQQKKNS